MPRASTDHPVSTYTIGDLAKEFGLTTRAIRFYEDQGLLSPERVGRNRLYHARDHTRLKLILRGKRLGFSLNEIRELIELFDTPSGEEKQLRRFLKSLAERRASLRQQQKDIEAVLTEIDGAESECQRLLAAMEADEARAARPTSRAASH